MKLSQCDSSQNFKMNDTELFVRSLNNKPLDTETPEGMLKQSTNRFLPSMSAGQTDSAATIQPSHLKLEGLLVKYEGQMRTHIKIESQLRVHIDCMYDKIEEITKENKAT